MDTGRSILNLLNLNLSESSSDGGEVSEDEFIDVQKLHQQLEQL
jgi:hypothetical protein